MSAYDNFLAETKTQTPTGQPRVVPVSVGDQSQPKVAPVTPTSAYARFQEETGVSPVVTPKATIVTPQVEKSSVLSTIGSGVGKVLDWFSKNQKEADEAQLKLKLLMTQGKESLASFENATPEEKNKALDAENQKIPFIKFLNSDTGKKITGFVARNSSNIPLKAYASFKAIGDTTYDEAYKALEDKAKDPNNTFAEKIFYGVQDSGVQSALGILLGLSVSAISRGRVNPMVVTTPYFASISAESQRQDKGRVDSLGNIAIDTIGDNVLSGFAESALKSVLKEGGESTLKRILKESGKGFTVEGSTEVAQSFLKYANDYKNAQTEEQKQVVVKDLANYVKEGGMAQEFLIGGIAGGIITGGASAIGGGKVDPNIVTKEETPVEKDSAYAKYAQEKGVDLSKPAIEIQKELEKVNAPAGTVPAEGIAPLEGVNPKNEAKITYEQATPIADKAVSRYWSEKIQPEIDNNKPIVIGADDLKDHFSKDYNDNNHPIYSQTAYKLFELALQRTKGDTVVLTAGGAGSGKTEIITKNLINTGFNGIVYDSNLANYDGAVKQIELAKKAGKKVEIRGVLPNLESSRTFTIQRENNIGRGISDATFARGHAGFPAVLEKLLANGIINESDVKVLDTRNTKTFEEAMDKAIDEEYIKNILDTLKNLGYNEDNIKTTYAKNNFNQTTGQRTNGEVPTSEGSRTTPTQNRTDKRKANRGSNGGVLSEEAQSKKEYTIDSLNEKTGKKDGTEYIVKFETSRSGKVSVSKYIVSNGEENFVDSEPLTKSEKRYQTQNRKLIAERTINPFIGYNYQTETYEVSPKQEEKLKEQKKSTKKMYDTLHRVDGEFKTIPKVVSSEGDILGNKVFTYKNDNGKYIVIDKKTGLSLSTNTYKTLKSAIENEKQYLIDKAGGEAKLKAMFTEAYKRQATKGSPNKGKSYASIDKFREDTYALEEEAKKYDSADEFIKALDEGQAGLYVDYTPIKRLLESNTGNYNLAKVGFDPNEIITVYRGIDDPTGKAKRKINIGDYVATTRELAESYTGDPKDVVMKKIKAKDFYLDEDPYLKDDFNGDFTAEKLSEISLEGTYNPKTPITKEQLTDIWNRANTKEAEAPSGSGYASIGRYREEGNVVAGKIDEVKAIEFPELLDLAKELSGNIPFIKKYTRANGMFYGRGTGEIGLNPELFKEGNLGQLQKTFAHEIGHLIDYLPDQTMKRGNVLGRLAVLKGFNKDFYAGAGATRTDAEVRSQLWELSKYWKPIDEENVPASFLSYRKSAPEVYADFISVLFNDPNLVAVKAPTAYNVFFEQLDKKPLVKKAYFELQDFLRFGDRVAKRRSATNQMFKLTEQQSRERQIQIQQEQEERERSIWTKFKTEFVDITEVVKEDVKRAEAEGKIINPDDNPTYYLEERNYLGGKIKSEVDTKFNNIYQDLQKEGMTWEDLGELMFYERILKGDRGEVANPLGYQPDFVQELMDTYEDVGNVKPDQEAHKKGTSDMKSTLGESKYIKLQELAVQYRQNLKSFFDQGRDEGIYSEDLAKLFEENAFYVPFKGAKYSGVSRTTFGVKQQKGTLGNIENPANTGIEKAVSIIRAIERNRVTRKTIEFYQENFGDEVIEAKRDQQGYPLPPKEEGQSLVTYMEDGKVKGFYIDSYIAEALQKNTIAKQNQIIGAIRFFNSGLFRPLFITFNLGFQSFNLIRDFKRFWKNVPDMTILRAMKLYGQSARASKIRAFGLPENPSQADREAYDLINKLENDKVISITYNDIIKGENIEDAQIDRILRETGVREAKQTKLGAIGEKIGVTKETPIIKQAFQILDFIEKTGNMIETLPKVAGVFALEGKMKPIEMRSFVRKYVGSPDFLAGGRDKKSVNEILLFANAIAQGIRSDYEIATQPKSRGAYWWKTAQSELLPKALMLAVTAGLFGDWLKDLFDKVSEYDKANYTIIPLGEDENGKAIYFRMPSDETGRLIGGTFWKLARAVGSPEKLAELETYTDILTYAGGQVPSVSPVVQLGAFTIPSFIAGNNPYDFFRGRPILTDEQQLAGGSERLKPFLSYMFQQMGGNVFMKLNYNEVVPKNPSLSEKIVGLPVASNIAGRFIKVSNYGETEKLREISNDIRSENARENIANRRVVFDYVDQAQGKSRGEQEALKRQMVKDILGETITTPEERRKKSTLEKRFSTLLIRGSADAKIDMLVTAQSNEEKVALLTEYQNTMSKEKFEELRKFVITNRVVSSEAYRTFIVNSNKK